MGHGEGGFVHDLAADQQDLRQHKHDQPDGENRAPAKALTDAHNGCLRGHHANQGACTGKDAAGGQNGGESKVHGFHNGIPMGHLGFQLLIPAGNHDGIVDIRAHLNGTNHQIAHEEQGRAGKGRNGEVNPDGALNHQNQQQRHTGRLEGEKQHYQHNEDGHNGNHQIICSEGQLKVLLYRGVAHHEDLSLRIIAPGNFPEGIQKGVGGFPALRQGQVDQHTVKVLSLKLLLCRFHLCLGFLQRIHLVIFQSDDSLIDFVADKEHHVDQRHFIGAQTSDNLTILLLLCGVSGIHRLRQLVVQPGKLRELPGT